MLHFPGKIPITIYPTFWLFAALIGYLNSMSLIGTLVWVCIIFVSILFHEFGHALCAILFGKSPRIELISLGGVTYHQGEDLPFWKQFLIVFNGPFFGFLLFIFGSLLLKVPALASGMSGAILQTFRGVNLFWTLLNLVPILPLDGGQLLRIVLEAFLGLKGLKYSLLFGVIVAVALSLFFFLYQTFLIGALFFLLAFQSFDAYRKMRHLAESDRKPSLKQALADAEKFIEMGKKEEALALLEKVRAESQKGMIYVLATQHLASILYEKGRIKESYDLLYPIRLQLSSDALCLLHRVAYAQRDFSLVVQVGGKCFQTLPHPEVALRNAFACAQLMQVRPVLGWLEAALREGLQNLQETLRDPHLDPVRSDPLFQDFIRRLKFFDIE